MGKSYTVFDPAWGEVFYDVPWEREEDFLRDVEAAGRRANPAVMLEVEGLPDWEFPVPAPQFAAFEADAAAQGKRVKVAGASAPLASLPQRLAAALPWPEADQLARAPAMQPAAPAPAPGSPFAGGPSYADLLAAELAAPEDAPAFGPGAPALPAWQPPAAAPAVLPGPPEPPIFGGPMPASYWKRQEQLLRDQLAAQSKAAWLAAATPAERAAEEARVPPESGVLQDATAEWLPVAGLAVGRALPALAAGAEAMTAERAAHALASAINKTAGGLAAGAVAEKSGLIAGQEPTEPTGSPVAYWQSGLAVQEREQAVLDALREGLASDADKVDRGKVEAALAAARKAKQAAAENLTTAPTALGRTAQQTAQSMGIMTKGIARAGVAVPYYSAAQNWAFWKDQGAASFLTDALAKRDLDAFSDADLAKMVEMADQNGALYASIEFASRGLVPLQAAGFPLAQGLGKPLAGALARVAPALGRGAAQTVTRVATEAATAVAGEMSEEGWQKFPEQWFENYVRQIENEKLPAGQRQELIGAGEQLRAALREAWASGPAVAGMTALGLPSTVAEVRGDLAEERAAAALEAIRSAAAAAPPALEAPSQAPTPPLPVEGDNVRADYPAASLTVAPQGEPLPPAQAAAEAQAQAEAEAEAEADAEQEAQLEAEEEETAAPPPAAGTAVQPPPPTPTPLPGPAPVAAPREAALPPGPVPPTTAAGGDTRGTAPPAALPPAEAPPAADVLPPAPPLPPAPALAAAATGTELPPAAPPAAAPAAPEITGPSDIRPTAATLKAGEQVYVYKTARSQKLHKAQVVQVLDEQTVRVKLSGEPGFRDMPMAQTQFPRQRRTRMWQEMELAPFAPAERSRLRADARQFDEAVRASPFYDFRKEEGAPSQEEAARRANRELIEARKRVAERLGQDPRRIKSIVARAKWLPMLRAWLAEPQNQAWLAGEAEAEEAYYARRRGAMLDEAAPAPGPAAAAAGADIGAREAAEIAAQPPAGEVAGELPEAEGSELPFAGAPVLVDIRPATGQTGAQGGTGYAAGTQEQGAVGAAGDLRAAERARGPGERAANLSDDGARERRELAAVQERARGAALSRRQAEVLAGLSYDPQLAEDPRIRELAALAARHGMRVHSVRAPAWMQGAVFGRDIFLTRNAGERTWRQTVVHEIVHRRARQPGSRAARLRDRIRRNHPVLQAFGNRLRRIYRAAGLADPTLAEILDEAVADAVPGVARFLEGGQEYNLLGLWTPADQAELAAERAEIESGTDETGAGEAGPVQFATSESADQLRFDFTQTEDAAPTQRAAAIAATSRPDRQPTDIQDFGEKIGGARKDRTPSADLEIRDADIAGMTLAQLWPKAEVDAIQDLAMAALATTLRAEIPAKPHKGYRLARWAEQVRTVRELMRIANQRGFDAVMDRMRASVTTLAPLAAKVNLLRQLPRETWGRIGAVRDYPNAERFEQMAGSPTGRRIPAPFAMAEVDNRPVRADSLAALPAAVTERLGVPAETTAAMQFEVRGRSYSSEDSGRWIIVRKGDKLYRPLKIFDGSTGKEALAYVKNNHAELVAAWEALKEQENVKETDVRRATNRPRTATDYRQGRDVTPEMFQDVFGFRGVEFGNWVAQGGTTKERQGMLNEAFDALHDLAAIIGVPPKAISLNGELALAFGARGHGWASAHYEPDKVVINLTKTRGAGSLAHEWFHSLDHYFQRQRQGAQRVTREGAEMMTFQPEGYYEHKQTGHRLAATRFAELRARGGIPTADDWTRISGVRPEVEQAFVALVQALNDSPMAQRAALIDKGQSSGYWSRIIERAARAFENYVIHKMAEHGYHNDYLANVKGIQEFIRNDNRYPYLLEAELGPVAEAFDDLFGTIETRETERGVLMFATTAPEADARYADLERRAQAGDKQAEAEAQRMVDEAAQRAGYSVGPVWRGDATPDQPTAYPDRKRREHGIFTTPDRRVAKIYSGPYEPRRFFVQGRKVLDLTQDTVEARQWVEKWAETFDDWIDRRSGEETTAWDVLESGQMFDYEGDWSSERWMDIQGTAEADGYDAVVLPDYDSDTGVFPSVVALNNNGVKLADPFTYRSDGTLIPLSERFNPDAPDIRFATTAPVTSPAGAGPDWLRRAWLDELARAPVWRPDEPEIVQHTSGAALTAHADHKAAKAGDLAAAQRLVRDLAKPDKLQALADAHPGARVAPVYAQETAGVNQIPLVLADTLARRGRLTLETGLVQISRAEHTGQNVMHRMLVPAMFAGTIERGADYILVDDMSTTGATLTAARHFVEANGGRVVGFTTLALRGGRLGSGKVLGIQPATLAALRAKFPAAELEEVLREYGIAPSLGHLSDQAGQYLRQFADLDSFRARAAQELAQGGGAPPRLASGRALRVGQTQGAADLQAEAVAEAEEEGKLRGFPRRLVEQDLVDEGEAAQIEADPELRYRPQSLADATAEIEAMSTAEKLARFHELARGGGPVDSDMNLAILAGLSALRDMRAAGQDYRPLLRELSRYGTMFGQLIRQFGELRGSTPTDVLALIDELLAEYHLRLDARQRAELEALIGAMQAAGDRVRAAEAAARAAWGPAELAALAAAEADMETAARALGRRLMPLMPKSVRDMGVAFLQGGLLTPISLLNNPLTNILWGAVREAERVGGWVTDALQSLATGTPRTVAAPWIGRGAQTRGVGQGLRRAARSIYEGSVPAAGEAYRSLHPWVALRKALFAEEVPAGGPAWARARERLKALVEGTLGWAPEAMLRMLPLGDEPVRLGERARGLAEQARLRGLRGAEAQKFVRFPDPAAVKTVEAEAREACFQQQNRAASWIMQGLAGIKDTRAIGGALHWLARTVVPFVKTPLNLVWTGLQIVRPEISLARAAILAASGRRRDAHLAVGRFAVGVVLKLGAYALLREGLLEGSPDDEKKRRALQYARRIPGTINLSALRRWIASGYAPGGSGGWQPGDELRSFTRFGPFGVQLSVVADRRRQIEAEAWRKKQPVDVWGKDFARLAADYPQLLRASLQMSAVKGTADLLAVVATGKDEAYQKWFETWVTAASSAAIPKTLEAWNRTRQEFLPDTAGRTWDEQLENVVRMRLGQADDLPPKRDLLGQPIRRTPEGAEPLWYQMFDVTKGQTVPADPLLAGIARAYEATGDSDAIPPVPARQLTLRGQTVELDAAQYSRLRELVGEEVRQRLENVDLAQPDEATVRALARQYRYAAEQGRRRFLAETGPLTGE